MLIKRIIFTGLILCLFFSIVKTASSDENISESIVIQKLIASINNFETNFHNSDKIDSSDFNKGIDNFNRLIELYTSFATQYPDSNFQQKAFIYLEKKKNLLLLDILNNTSNTTHFTNGEKEASVIQILNDSSKVSEVGRNLFFFMKQPVDIADLQKNFLDDHDVILDFWIQKEKIFVFMLTKDSLQIVHWEVPTSQVKTKINTLISPFFDNVDLLRLEFDSQIAYLLYQYLFQPLEKHINPYKVLYIIPDNFLIGFPFELLVTDTTIHKKQKNKIFYHRYSFLYYLIKKYAISYNYSTAIFALEKGLDRTTNKLGRRLLTMSEPFIPPGTDEFIERIGNLSSYKLELSDYSTDEIKRISRLLFRHDNLKGKQATKSYLFENGHTYRWLYFALPGILDNSNPLNSGLLFAPETNDSLSRSNWLLVHESMQSILSADLLTLSASQVMQFNTEGNPGVIALPQSFLFSGVKSMLFSLWRINSISTSQFMSKFYWELKYKRQTNALALQEAKVASMKDTFTFKGKEISRAHPYFWATFQLIGNPKIRPPSPNKIPPSGVIIMVYVIVIAVSLYITRKTLPGRK
jgi:CHAT domain-containing protein